jgi:hypothetical protein
MNVGDEILIDLGSGNIINQKIVDIEKDENERIIGYTTINM